MMDWGPTMSSWMAGWMWLPTLLLIVVVLVGLAVLLQRSPTNARETETAVAIAARRLARGEITKEQFEQLRSTLSDS